MKSKLASILTLLQLLVVFLSWLVTAVAPQLYTRSLLSGEGIRWFLGRFADNLAHPLLVWLILIAIAWGTLSRSTLPSALLKLSRRQPVLYRQRFGLRVVAIELVLFAVVVLLLTAVPQAILLSASGQLFPSSFSSSQFWSGMRCFTLPGPYLRCPHQRPACPCRLAAHLCAGHAAVVQREVHSAALAFLAISNKAVGRWQ